MTIFRLGFPPSKARLIYESILLLNQKPTPYQHCSKRLLSKCKSKGPPWRILFLGSDDFALKSLQSLCSKFRTGTLISKLDIVTSNAKNLVGSFAQEEKLNYFLWPIDESSLRGQYDLGIVVSFGHLIPEEVINAFPLGMINAHGSLLPRWRGASPIVYAIMHGDQETGVTITKIKPSKFDTGDVVRQYRCHIAGDETNLELRERLAHHSSELLIECVRDLPRCLSMSQPQSEDGVTYAPKLTKELAKISWMKMTSRDIYNKHRALSHIYPLTTKWKGDFIKFLDISFDMEELRGNGVVTGDVGEIQTQSALSFLNVSKKKEPSIGTGKSAVSFLNSTESPGKSINKIRNASVEPGLVKFDKSRNVLSVMCCDGRSVLVNKLIVVGRKTMTAADFYNGFVTKVSNVSDRMFKDFD